MVEPRRQQLSGFNAATARRPWRTFLIQGNEEELIALQCGHSQKAVENHCLSRRLVGRPVASMRPQPEGRGEHLNTAMGDGDDDDASMRPQPEGRGELRACGLVRGEFPQASMRPQPEGRGEPESPRPGRHCHKGFNAATARRPWRTTQLSVPATPIDRFNAATARRPWRTGTIEGIHDALKELQCGHSQKAVENLALASDRRRDLRRFNAATARRPWRTGNTWT